MIEPSTVLFFAGLLLLGIAFLILWKTRSNPIRLLPVQPDLTQPEKQHGFKNRYMAYMKSREWETLAATALKNNENVCQVCDKKAQAAHHKHYPADFKDDCLDNLLVVCNACHYKIHREHIQDKKLEALFSENVLAGKQHVRIEVRRTRNNSLYILITELRADEQGRPDDIKLVLFQEIVDPFVKTMIKAAKFVKSRRLLSRF